MTSSTSASENAAPTTERGRLRATIAKLRQTIANKNSIEDLSYAPTTGGGDTTNPSLLVYLPAQPNNPNPPDVIGPFDKNKSAGQGSTG